MPEGTFLPYRIDNKFKLTFDDAMISVYVYIIYETCVLISSLLHDLSGQSLTSNIDSIHDSRNLLTSIQGDFLGRRLEDGQCDAKFIYCLNNSRCISCFQTLAVEDIDWTGIARGTSCSDVIQFLTDGGHCTSLVGDVDASQTFCTTFDACVVWTDDDDFYNYDDAIEPDRPGKDDNTIDCASLTECDWEGIHKNWVGDGVCHDNLDGCYNTAICGYDGGDCCQDTCNITSTSTYVECGHDGYACRDPASDYCNSDLSTKCSSSANGGSNNDPDPRDTKCKDDETKYRLVMYDSFGDGWDLTTLTINDEDDGKAVFTGGLVDGFQGTEYICLSKSPKCYNAKTQGGTWGVEVSWDVHPLSEGSPSSKCLRNKFSMIKAS